MGVRAFLGVLLAAALFSGLCFALPGPPDDEDGRVVVAAGGGAPPPGPTHTSWGTAQGDAVVTVTDVTLGAGDLLTVWVGTIFTGGGSTLSGTVDWRGTALTQVVAVDPIGDGCTSFGLYYLPNSAAASGTVTYTNTGGSDVLLMMVSSWSGCTATPLDAIAVATGTDAAPTVTTAVTAQANEILVACVAQPGSLSSTRTWGNGITDGQLITDSFMSATDCVLELPGLKLTEGYKQLASAAAQTASKSGGIASRWSIAAATFKF